jgi:hypothetical protein
MGVLSAAAAISTTGGCGAMDASAMGDAPGNAADSGSSGYGGSTSFDGALSDSRVESDIKVVPPTPPPNVMLGFVHASPNLWPFRACLKNANGQYLDTSPLPSDAAAVMPHSNRVGVAPGGALLLRHLEEIAVPETFAYTLGLIRTDGAVDISSLSCAQAALSPDYREIKDTIVTVRAGETLSLFVLHGCIPGTGSMSVACGDNPSVDNGNLRLTPISVYDLNSPAPPTNKARIALAHLSPAADSFYLADAGASDTLTLKYSDLVDPSKGIDLLSAKSSITSVDGGYTGKQLVEQEIDLPDTTDAAISEYGTRGFSLLAPTADAQSSVVLSVSLATVQDLSETKALPPAFWHASSHFLVALIGDPTNDKDPLSWPDGGENPFFGGYGLHMIAIPLRARESGGTGDGGK